MGTGEITRYLSTYGSARVSKAVLLSAIPPFLLKTGDDPGVDESVFDRIKATVLHDRRPAQHRPVLPGGGQCRSARVPTPEPTLRPPSKESSCAPRCSESSAPIWSSRTSTPRRGRYRQYRGPDRQVPRGSFDTGSPRGFATIERLGATPIDHTSTTVEKYVAEHTADGGFDVVLDTVGGATLDTSFLAARVCTGHVVSALGWGQHSIAPLSFRGATYSGVFTLLPMLTGRAREHHGEMLAAITRLVDDGHLAPLLDPRRFTLDTVAAAHRLVEAGTNNGKVVIDISSDS